MLQPVESVVVLSRTHVRAATALLACNGRMSIERAADLGVLLAARVATGFAGGLVNRVETGIAHSAWR